MKPYLVVILIVLLSVQLLSLGSTGELSPARTEQTKKRLSLLEGHPIRKIAKPNSFSRCTHSVLRSLSKSSRPSTISFPFNYNKAPNSDGSIVLQQEAVRTRDFHPDVQTIIRTLYDFSFFESSGFVESGFSLVWTSAGNIWITKPFSSFQPSSIEHEDAWKPLKSILDRIQGAEEIVRIQGFHIHPKGPYGWAPSIHDIDHLETLQTLLQKLGIQVPLDEHILLPEYSFDKLPEWAEQLNGSPKTPFLVRVTLQPSKQQEKDQI